MAGMAQYVYTMNRVSKIVPPKRQILKDISLSFFPGAKIGVLGLNGSGKSTLLKIMAGIDKEYEGEATAMPGLRSGTCRRNPSSSPSRPCAKRSRAAWARSTPPRQRLEEVYAAYAEPDADFDALAGAGQARGHHRGRRRRAAASTSWKSRPTRCACRPGTP
jgi:sulfate-transporting ATPase